MNAKLLFAAAVLTLSASASAQSTMDPQIQDVLIETCAHAQDNDRISLNKTLKANRLSKQRAVDKVVCDGKTLVNFARCIFRDDLASDFGMSRPPISVSSGH